MNCFEFHDLLQRRLDGEFRIESPALDRHLEECAQCRTLEMTVQSLEAALDLGAPLAAPAGLAGRIVVRALAERRARRRQRLVSAAVAASLLAAALIGYTRFPVAPGEAPPTPEIAAAQTIDPPPAVALQQSVREAGSALVALMGRTADEAIEQGRVLLPAALAKATVMDADSLPLDPPVRSLREAGQGVSAGLQPVTTSARRAVDLFLREMPAEVKIQK